MVLMERNYWPPWVVSKIMTKWVDVLIMTWLQPAVAFLGHKMAYHFVRRIACTGCSNKNGAGFHPSAQLLATRMPTGAPTLEHMENGNS